MLSVHVMISLTTIVDTVLQQVAGSLLLSLQLCTTKVLTQQLSETTWRYECAQAMQEQEDESKQSEWHCNLSIVRCTLRDIVDGVGHWKNIPTWSRDGSIVPVATNVTPLHIGVL